jgi:hypothetical protein
MPDHQQCLEGHHRFIVLGEVTGKHQDLLRSHGVASVRIGDVEKHMRGKRAAILQQRAATAPCEDNSRLHFGQTEHFALEIPLEAVFFNDAGVGKENAGIVALDMLQANGIAAGAVAHTSAKIGDSRDTWDNGVISRVNPAARLSGLAPGMLLCTALTRLISR